jgi:hypothetical protein
MGGERAEVAFGMGASLLACRRCAAEEQAPLQTGEPFGRVYGREASRGFAGTRRGYAWRRCATWLLWQYG